MNLDMAVTLVIVGIAFFFVVRNFLSKQKSGSCGCGGCSGCGKDLGPRSDCSDKHCH